MLRLVLPNYVVAESVAGAVSMFTQFATLRSF